MMKDKELLSIYKKGFEEENDVYLGKLKRARYKDILQQKAYNLGRFHYIMGDDLKLIDSLTEITILKLIKDEE